MAWKNEGPFLYRGEAIGIEEYIPRIGITMGDPAGIGPEIILKALADPDIQRLCRIVILGDERVLGDVAEQLGVISHKSEISIINLSNLNPHILTGMACGKAMAAYIKKAVEIALKGEVDAIVTAPINKELLNMAGFAFPGHTEFIAKLTGAKDVCMMLAGERLKVSLVTTHCPLMAVSRLLNRKGILKTIRLTHKTLVDYFGAPSPRIAVASLNPHGGEKGLFGREERYLIRPAVKEAVRFGINAIGPLPSDTLFYKALKGSFDAVVTMYHDQGLIPIKLLYFGRAVNITLGLPIIRTSVDHGTAYDIAGKGVADPSSLLQAIKTAVSMALKKRPANHQPA
ncbi:MAG: 4-hydroxythreonine-4-phosphate dehydrogenase PdxA [Thermodesulfobacteriota bacterium]